MASENKFSKTFENQKTDDAVKYVKNRVVRGANTNNHVADFLKKYAEIEHDHAKRLERLVKNVHPSGHDLGTFEESWSSFVQLVATEAVEAYKLSEGIQKDVVPEVRNSSDRKEMHRVLDSMHADSKTLSERSYHAKALTGFDHLQDIEEKRLQKLRESIGKVAESQRQNAAKTAQIADELNTHLATFDPAQDIDSYLAQVAAGDVKFPDLSPANSAGYSSPVPNFYASPALSPATSNGLRPQASPFTLHEERKESHIKRFFGKK